MRNDSENDGFYSKETIDEMLEKLMLHEDSNYRKQEYVDRIHECLHDVVVELEFMNVMLLYRNGFINEFETIRRLKKIHGGVL